MHKSGKAINAKTDVQACDSKINPLNRQLDDARLFGGKKFIPTRVKLQQCCACLGFDNRRVILVGGFQVPMMISGWRNTARN